MRKEVNADVIVVGAGMAGLSAAACLTAKGKRVLILEQNWIPGGCAASYPRKHVRYEAGATTLVGIEKGMPMGLLSAKTGIKFSADELAVPMEIHFQGEEISFPRDKNLEDWILRCEGIFGKEGQAEFWRYCYRISELVWEASGRYLRFPPERFSDLLTLAKKFHPKFLRLIPLAFTSTFALLRRFGLEKNEMFLKFVNQQLLITAQSKANEANALFGATALCYPLIPNYYVKGGIGKVADTVWQYLDKKGAELRLRTSVNQVIPGAESVEVLTDKGSFHAAAVLFAIPVNSLLSLLPEIVPGIRDFRNMNSLWSAFQCSIHAISGNRPNALHHQIHLAESLSGLSSESIFVSFSHPDDWERCGPGECVISVSTHVPADQYLDKKQKAVLEQAVVKIISDKGWIKGEPLNVHSAVHGAWEKWAGRIGGAVGGYPQLLKIKPWQMNGSRTSHKRIYLAGDSCYPGQGIPGAVLGGIIGAEKLLSDGVLRN